MAVFSPARLIRVLTTLVDRSLDEQEAVSGDGNGLKTAEADFSKARHRHLELIGRENNGKPRDDIQ
jgi:hypothetical protein